jgi:hypothetical protein
MSFSNADTGNKAADPYKEANADTGASLKVKVEDLEAFVKSTKLGMLTTREAGSGHLVSRCMGVVETVSPPSSRLSVLEASPMTD